MPQPFSLQQARERLKDLPGWRLQPGNTIERTVTTQGFMQAVALINAIAKIAEQQNHHPDLHLTGYKQLRIELCTHDAGGLTENDFEQARRINLLVPQ
jgi:4a-hydroxytetrahydrobiopterin dehydratase